MHKIDPINVQQVKKKEEQNAKINVCRGCHGNNKIIRVNI